MRKCIVFLIVSAACGCASAPQAIQWTQAGKTTQETQSDYSHCEKVAMQESNAMRSTDPFKEDILKEQCMKRLGYVKQNK